MYIYIYIYIIIYCITINMLFEVPEEKPIFLVKRPYRIEV